MCRAYATNAPWPLLPDKHQFVLSDNSKGWQLVALFRRAHLGLQVILQPYFVNQFELGF